MWYGMPWHMPIVTAFEVAVSVMEREFTPAESTNARVVGRCRGGQGSGQSVSVRTVVGAVRGRASERYLRLVGMRIGG